MATFEGFGQDTTTQGPVGADGAPLPDPGQAGTGLAGIGAVCHWYGDTPALPGSPGVPGGPGLPGSTGGIGGTGLVGGISREVTLDAQTYTGPLPITYDFHGGKGGP